MKTYQKVALLSLTYVFAVACVAFVCAAAARAADSPPVSQMVIVPAAEESRFVLSKAVKVEDSDGSTLLAILVLADYPSLDECLSHLDSILKSNLPDDRKAGISCVKMTRMVNIIKGSSL